MDNTTLALVRQWPADCIDDVFLTLSRQIFWNVIQFENHLYYLRSRQNE